MKFLLTVIFATCIFNVLQAYEDSVKCYLKTHQEGKIIGKVQFVSRPHLHNTKIQFLNSFAYSKNISDGKHGFHVHANGVQNDDCLTAGGHYNPYSVDHGGPTATERHEGDFGNVVAAGGRYSVTRQIEVSDVNSLKGRAVVLHAGEDDLGLGDDEGSRKTGNAGARLACCTLQ